MADQAPADVQRLGGTSGVKPLAAVVPGGEVKMESEVAQIGAPQPVKAPASLPLRSSASIDAVTVSAPSSPVMAAPSPSVTSGRAASVRASTPSTSALAMTSAVVGQRKERGPKQMKRNIDRVFYGPYDIKTWYFSPYPFDEDEWTSMAGPSSAVVPAAAPAPKKKGRVPSGAAAASAAAAAARRSALAASEGESGQQQTASHHGGALSTSSAQAPALAAIPAIATSSASANGAPATPLASPAPHQPAAKSLWVCDGCFKYMRTYAGHRAHKRECKYTHPPGRKVYQRGAHIIWEVDGDKEKLYAQNLSLFGKLFIDHKTIYFDVEPFLFYVLTDASPSFDHVLGFFSKEKISYDDYNLACIITFPPFQKKGYGTLMIEFSYYLSSLTNIIGTPERPLSDLGFRGYLAYWSAAVLRALAIAFNEDDGEVLPVLFAGALTAMSPQASRNVELPSAEAASSPPSASFTPRRQRLESVRIRRTLLGLPPLPSEAGVKRQERSSSAPGEEVGEDDDDEDEEAKVRAKRLRRVSRGWAGEIPRGVAKAKAEGQEQQAAAPPAPVTLPAPVIASLDTNHGASTLQGQMALCTTLDRISKATNLRTDDVAFALAECGLLRSRARAKDGEGKRVVSFGLEKAGGFANGVANGHVGGAEDATSGQGEHHVKTELDDDGHDEVAILITRQAVKEALVRRKVKRPVLDTEYALL